MIEKSVILPLSQERAFKLFTERAGAWWPADRRHTADPQSEILIEAGGRFVERARDGREVPMGRVLEWAPPERLLLAFYPGTGPEQPTEVTVRFVPVGQGTEVHIEHRPTAASAAIWEARAPRFVASWDLVLPALAAFVAGQESGNKLVTR